MEEFIRALDKAELHVHLEGSITPETVAELDPSMNVADVRDRYQYQDFRGFLNAYKWVNGFLRQPRDYGLITRRLGEALALQGVTYAEVNVSTGVMLWRNLEFDAIFDAICAAANESPVPMTFIFDATRQFGIEHGWAVARRAVACRDRGVIGFGVGGDEALGPAHIFSDVFAYVRDNGLHVLPHAGESVGPTSVWAALECGAKRIGHGIRAIEDDALVAHLREHDIPLEISISSNVCTGVVSRLEDHPVRRLWDAGVPIVLNTDDPPMFHTTLVREYMIAVEVFGFTRDELAKLAANSLRYALGRKA